MIAGAEDAHCDVCIFSAFGCGAFGNPPEETEQLKVKTVDVFFFALMFLRLDFLLKIEDLKGVALGRRKHGKNKHFIVNDLVAIVLQLSSLEFCFFLRSCGVVCDGNYSLKNAQGSGRGRLDSLVVQFPLLHFGTRRWRDSLKKSCNSRVWRRRGGFLPVKEVEEGEDSKS